MELPEFDTLVKMAQESPDELEALREEMVESVISSARQDFQRRLRGLQFQIDMTRAKSKTPLAACIRITELMYDSFHDLHTRLNEPYNFSRCSDGSRLTDSARMTDKTRLIDGQNSAGHRTSLDASKPEGHSFAGGAVASSDHCEQTPSAAVLQFQEFKQRRQHPVVK